MKWLGWLALLLCGVMLFIWIPLDVETGIIEKVRRQVTLGDAFAPSIAAVIIGLGGLLILLERPQGRPELSSQTTAASGRSLRPPGMADVRHATIVLVLVTISLVLMRYAGPLILKLLEGSDAQYRLLRDTAPWKYIGFMAGGLWLIISLIVFNERRLRWQHILIALVAVLVLIAFYDFPFEDLLLPPNGDV
ncbi:MAG: hypothetical protein AAF404_09395 [Pseudomonadota bacterium]